MLLRLKEFVENVRLICNAAKVFAIDYQYMLVVIKLKSVEKVSKVLDAIRESHNGFPVIGNDNETFIGTISKHILTVLLNKE